ncbi:MAG: M48 family metallopeptidase [Chlamydiota bacterium]
MDFWAAQDRARKKTKIYVTIFVVITLIVATLSELAMRAFAPDTYQTNFPIVGLIFIALTFIVAGWNYSMYSSFGGSYVAKSIGAREIDPETTNPHERQLLNIVQEMALASGLSMPAVFIIPAKQINAFAAGMNTDNAAIAITEGALITLNRDEVQGVIAHEFGHIYNGDMCISMRLAAMIMGFFFVFFIGLRLIQVSALTGGRSSSNRQKGADPVALAALIFMVAGIITYIAGKVLQAMVSREREYLADACSVQFTRNPNGIANALRKIASEHTAQDMPKTGAQFAHMYLNDRSAFSALFATHPPIEKRIAAIEGKTYLPDEWKEGISENQHFDS